MQQEIRENVLKLTSANKLLVTERESKYRLAAAEENVRLMELLNAEMERHLERMNDMIDGLERSNNKQRDIARITLLMCYIKRRCSLFFKEQEGGDMPAGGAGRLYRRAFRVRVLRRYQNKHRLHRKRLAVSALRQRDVRFLLFRA